MDRGAWWATVHSVIQSDTTEATEHAHVNRKMDIHYAIFYLTVISP